MNRRETLMLIETAIVNLSDLQDTFFTLMLAPSIKSEHNIEWSITGEEQASHIAYGFVHPLALELARCKELTLKYRGWRETHHVPKEEESSNAQ